MNKKVIFSLIAFAVIVLGIKNLGYFFDVTVEAKPADIIVSLGGDNGNRIKKTLVLYENNLSASQKIIITGVDDFDPTMKKHELDWRADYLIKKGIQEKNIIFNSEAKTTFKEMQYIKKYLLDHNMSSVIIVTNAPHSRRISFILETILHYNKSGITYSIVGSDDPWWDEDTYYDDPTATAFVLNESLKISYYYLQYLLGNFHE
jgi:uncharacterized SAM-binding protein YcdF (DUF218 family)